MVLWRFERGFLDQQPETAVPGLRLRLTASHMPSLQSVSACGAVLFGHRTDVEGPRLTNRRRGALQFGRAPRDPNKDIVTWELRGGLGSS
jgi:hypothetical protein